MGYQAGKQLDGEHSRAVVSATSKQSHRVILHVSASNSMHFSKALDWAKDYVRELEDAGEQVVVTAPAECIDLMRTGVAPNESQVLETMRDYDNVHLTACANAIRALAKKGH